MHILLIAYEFPPSPSPQSLRWTYLSRHLADMGHRITVLTIRLGGHTAGLPSVPDSIIVHRTYAGPVRGTLAALRDRRAKIAVREPPSSHATSPPPLSNIRSRHGWKQIVSDSAQGIAAKILFPDVRGEWLPWGTRELRKLLREDMPDAVISSHEPATSLELGLLAARKGIPWIADLGDPILASYTPARWRDRSLRLEQEVCLHADHITVTTDAAAKLLLDRHGRSERISIIHQGYEADSAPQSHGVVFDPTKLELLYTGSFYAFRRPDALLAALDRFPGARLNIAAITTPEIVVNAARNMPDRIRLLGFLPHRQAIALQRNADVLLNIGNADPSQVPGKVYEYLGSQRPILHLGSADDAIARLMARLRRGWSCANTSGEIAAWLQNAIEAKQKGMFTQGLDLGLDSVNEWSWQRLATRVDEILSSTLR